MIGLKLRLGEDLHAQLKKAAKKNSRSLNSEMLHRLSMTFGREGVALAIQSRLHEKEIIKVAKEQIRYVIKEATRKALQ